MIKIDFSKTHDVYGTFADAIHLEDDHSFTDDEIETMKQQRFDNWVAHIVEMSNRPVDTDALSAAELTVLYQATSNT